MHFKAPETASALPEAIIGGVVVAVIVTVVVIVVVVLVMVIRKHRGTYPAGVQKRYVMSACYLR